MRYLTNMKHLNIALNGDLSAGLYVLGAIPNIGKSTFALQKDAIIVAIPDTTKKAEDTLHRLSSAFSFYCVNVVTSSASSYSKSRKSISFCFFTMLTACSKLSCILLAYVLNCVL